MTAFRLGWLNIWNPLKPEGALILDLSRREEKQILRMLILLCSIEPGENWIGETFRKSREETVDADWHLPVSWFNEDSLPNSGIVALRYFSGEGAGLKDCNPNVRVRIMLTSLVHAQAYPGDLKNLPRPTLTLANAAISDFGSRLSFGRLGQL